MLDARYIPHGYQDSLELYIWAQRLRIERSHSDGQNAGVHLPVWSLALRGSGVSI